MQFGKVVHIQQFSRPRDYSTFLEFVQISAKKRKNMLNPFTLRAAKRGLTILGIFYLNKHFLENI